MKKTIVAASAAFILLAAAATAIYALRGSGTLPDRLAELLGVETSGEETEQRSARAVRVVAAAAEKRTARDLFETTGVIVAEDRVMLTSRVTGVVEGVEVQDGAGVRTGDAVVRFDSSDEQAALQAARARMEELRAELERARTLAADDFATQARVETARAAYEAARADVRRAQELLEDQTVRAPFDGRIGFVEVSPGALVEPGMPVASLVTPEKLSIRFSVPVEVANSIGVGTPVLVSLPGLDAPEPAKIAIIAPLALERTRAVEAEALLPPAAANLLPGSFLTAHVVVNRRENAVFVPETALVREGMQSFVFKVDQNEKARRIDVVSSTRQNGFIEVEGDIRPGDRVVVEGAQKLRDGAPVVTAERDNGGIGE